MKKTKTPLWVSHENAVDLMWWFPVQILFLPDKLGEATHSEREDTDELEFR